MTQPAFLLNVADEERAELEALGISLTPPADATDAARDQWADSLLRHEAEERANIARYEAAREAWIAEIHAKYDALVAPCLRRAETLNAAARALAAVADFGKKKSRALAYGTYGRRAVPEKIVVADEPAVLRWACESVPALVRVTVVLDLARVREFYPTFEAEGKLALSKTELNKYVKSTGDEPLGVTIEPARDEAFAKVAE